MVSRNTRPPGAPDEPPPAGASNDGPLSQDDYENLARFRSALRRFLAFSEAATSAAGMGPLQYQALLAIRASPMGALAMKTLAEELLLLPHSAVQLVNRLVRAGLVAREPSPTDRRSVLVTLTPRGATKLAELALVHRAELVARRRLLAESLRRLRGMGQPPSGRRS